jgi:hypothetical protein
MPGFAWKERPRGYKKAVGLQNSNCPHVGLLFPSNVEDVLNLSFLVLLCHEHLGNPTTTGAIAHHLTQSSVLGTTQCIKGPLKAAADADGTDSISNERQAGTRNSQPLSTNMWMVPLRQPETTSF